MNNPISETQSHSVIPPDPLLLNALVSAAQSLMQSLYLDTFYTGFLQMINQLVPTDSLVILEFEKEKQPVILHDALHPREKRSFYDIYMSGAYLLSPLYQNWQELPDGFFRIDDISLDDLEGSDFSRAYYQDCGLSDEANFVVHLDESKAVAVCFGRQQLSMPFSPMEVHYLHLVEPMFRTAIYQHEKKLRSSKNSRQDNTDIENVSRFPGHTILQERLQSFGASLLTEREQEVVAQILKGKSSKLSARELNITPDTERSHRKRIYSKLGVTSQTELFSLVLNHLVSAE